MRFRLAALLSLLLTCAPRALPAQALLPWDIYLACQGAMAPPDARMDSGELNKARAFCDLGLPRIGVRYAESEKERWKAALAPGAMPLRTTMEMLRRRGEDVIAVRVQSVNQIVVGGQALLFDFKQSFLNADSRQILSGMVDSLKAVLVSDTARTLEIVGYADSPDPSQDVANLSLARARADAIVEFLRSEGISKSRLVARGQIVRLPRNSSSSPLARQATVLDPDAPQGGLVRPNRSGATPGAPLSASAFLVGTTDFLVEKAREQVEVFLLQEGSNRICTQLDWKKLLRTTCGLIGSDTALYRPGIEAIRSAIRDDLRDLPFTLAAGHLSSFAQSTPLLDRRDAALFLLDLVGQLQRVAAGASPLDAFAPLQGGVTVGDVNVDALTRTLAPLSPLVEHLNRARALVSAVRSAREDLSAYWHGDVLADSVALYTVKALAFRGGEVAGQYSFAAYRDGFAAHAGELVQGARDAQRIVQTIQSKWEQFRALPADSARAAARAALLSDVLGDASEMALSVLPTTNPQVKQRLELVRASTGPALELITYVRARNYAAALNATVRLAYTATPGKELNHDQLRVLGFASDIAQASESGDVRSAFQRLVGDGPGYQGKRQAGGRYWRVNAYVGVSGAMEFLTDAPAGVTATGGAVGVAAPIGVEFGHATVGRHTNAIFVQLVDLGAIASARINTRGVETFPDFQFGSVIAPGIFYVHGFGNTPFTLGIGGAFVPNARSTDTGENVAGIRPGAFAAVDIPLFP